MLQQVQCLLLLFIAIIINSLFSSTSAQYTIISSAQPTYFPSANISTKWINSPSLTRLNITNNRGVLFPAGIRPIIIRETSGLEFACGFEFACLGLTCNSFVFSIFLGNMDFPISRVWSANRDHPVQENATLEFSINGELLLRDFDGTLVWSTHTSGKSVVRMEVNEVASLVLFDNKNNTVWSSMDYPTDSLVLGQTLRLGQRLTADVSPTNSSQGPFYLSIVSNGIQASFGSQLYYEYLVYPLGAPIHIITFNNGSLGTPFRSNVYAYFILPRPNSIQYMQLDYMGHLKLYEWISTDVGWVLLKDVLPIDDCEYPTVCGEYGTCSNGKCSCPASATDNLTYFRPVNNTNLNAGCMPINAISCKLNKTQQFLSLPNTSYFNNIDDAAIYTKNTNAESCKQACSKNCSCKAALFWYGQNDSIGNCFLPSELYSLAYQTPRLSSYNSTAFIKVQSFPITNPASGANSNNFVKKKVNVGVKVGVKVGASAASLLALILIVFVACGIALVRRYIYREVDDEDDEFYMLPGIPTRFAFEDLRVATNDFLRKLGEGGFGSVFEGTLIDGTKIAVKRLDCVGQGKKEFLAEVESIGSIHHIHLVRLIGFCAEKLYRLLVYEYMYNGSLDKWIFYKERDIVLDWQTRRRIINDIAKGLAYLHEDCRHKIVHLDIKPQNILLDENFNAKISDFGLAKLISRDQIEVMTRMRGTPGYLAPEWLTSVITEKVDVFSFGVVLLEIICGRRNLDYSKDEESFHLITILQRKVVENKLVDMVDCRCTDMQIYIKDVIMIMHLAMWCLQSDSNKRPLMSVVLKVLDGSSDVPTNLDYNFIYYAPRVSRNANMVESFQPTPLTLSGPR